MDGVNQTNKRNYRSLIVAGAGTIGRALITIGAEQFSLFEHIVAIDRDDDVLLPLRCAGITLQAGDITEPHFLKTLFAAVPGPCLFVNLCAGTDNVRIRKNLALYDTAYLDSCASSTLEPDEYRFSRLMPYTYTEIDSSYPHWLCWGINPGLVEIITRRILAQMPGSRRPYDVTVYEFDRLTNGADPGRAAVGWCPEALVEEIMLAPTMEIVGGIPCEDDGSGTRSCRVNWGGRPIRARMVGHEDIWNLAAIPGVTGGRFYYSLDGAVMDILDTADAGKARSMLYIPASDETVTGLEQVAVQVREENTTTPETLVWTEDHARTQQRYGVNAVQYQTAKSLLLAIMLLQRSDYGRMPMSRNASNLPIGPHDWPMIERFLQELDINWHDGAHLNLHVIGSS